MGAGLKEWPQGPEWQQGEAGQPGRALQNTQVPKQAWPPSHVCPAEAWRGLGATWVLHSVVASTQLSGEGLALYLGSWKVAPRPGGFPNMATHTLTSSSSSASANSKVFACTELGTGVLLPAWGAPHPSSRLSQEARAWGGTSTSSR